MTEQGGCADNACSVEPREAQRPTSLAARTPITVSPLATGDTAVGARRIVYETVRQAGLRYWPAMGEP